MRSHFFQMLAWFSLVIAGCKTVEPMKEVATLRSQLVVASQYNSIASDGVTRLQNTLNRATTQPSLIQKAIDQTNTVKTAIDNTGTALSDAREQVDVVEQSVADIVEERNDLKKKNDKLNEQFFSPLQIRIMIGTFILVTLAGIAYLFRAQIPGLGQFLARRKT